MGLLKDYLDDLTAEQKAQILGGIGTFFVVVMITLGIIYYEMRDQEILRECIKAGHGTTECRELVR